MGTSTRMKGVLGAIGAAGLLLAGSAAMGGPSHVRDGQEVVEDTAVPTEARPARMAGVHAADGGRVQTDPRLSDVEAAVLRATVGYAPPKPGDGVEWIGEAVDWEALRGRVVVVQSWTSTSQSGRNAMMATLRRVSRINDEDLAVVLVHTPEGAEHAEGFLKRTGERMSLEGVVYAGIDSTGAFCDEMGFYRTPATVVIGRDGAIRHVGVTPAGLLRALRNELAREHDADAEGPAVLPAREERALGERDSFPEFTDPIRNAQDLRGRAGPSVEVEEWLSEAPSMDGRVVMVEFWATWCGPCRASIPHLNELHAEYGEELVIVAVSDEDPETVRGFMEGTEMHFPVATDRSRRMTEAVQNRRIPHAIVMCGEGVVRWQGHPMGLQKEDLAKILEANRAGEVGPRWVS